MVNMTYSAASPNATLATTAFEEWIESAGASKLSSKLSRFITSLATARLC